MSKAQSMNGLQTSDLSSLPSAPAVVRAMRPVTVLISDPPWRFVTRSAKGGKKTPKYDTMSLAELMELKDTVQGLAGKHCYHAMWTTAPMLADAMTLLAHWGFSYKTFRIWHKNKLGTGYHVRSNAEIVLIGCRGAPGIPSGVKQRTIFDGTPLTKQHSSKPIELHNWLECGFPLAAKKIELFARKDRDGWQALGGDLGYCITPAGVIQTLANTGSDSHAYGDTSGGAGLSRTVAAH